MNAARCNELDVLAEIAARGKAWRAALADLGNVTPIGLPTLDVVQRELEAVIENIDYGVYVMGPDYRTRIINSTFQDMWLLPDEFVEQGTDFFETIEYLRHIGMYDVSDEDWPAYVKSRFEDVQAAAGTPRESRRRDGRVLLYKCLPLPDGGRMLTYFDITEQKLFEKQLEESTLSLQRRVGELEQLRHELRSQRDAAVRGAQEIKESQELLAEAIESIDEAVLVWGTDRRLIACNERIRQIFPELADAFQLGNSFEQVVRAGVAHGVFALRESRTIEEFVDVRWQLEEQRLIDEQVRLMDGRWLRINRRKTPHGKRVVTISDITEEKESEASLIALAANDALTGLANRRTFDAELAAMASRFEATDQRPPVGLLLIDLDEFKQVNDKYGHPTGDEVLKIAARRISGVVRKVDVAARIGGDEFAIILRNAPDEGALRRTADRLIRTMSAPIRVEEKIIFCSFSIGGAHCRTDACGISQLVELADRSLYAVKKGGRNGLRMHTDLDAEAYQFDT